MILAERIPISRRGKTMLVLSRRVGEEIIIAGNIRVTVASIKGDKVRIGITAPPDVRVDREEIHNRIREFIEPDAFVRGK
jgi:carbon storage regulator